MGSVVYVIDPDKCTECKGFHDEPQCVSLCPVLGCCVPLAPSEAPTVSPDLSA
jgi:ferredoxin